MREETQIIYQDIAHSMDCTPVLIETTIGTLCHGLTTSPMGMALLVYWLIREDHKDHVVYKQFMMVFQRMKGVMRGRP